MVINEKSRPGVPVEKKGGEMGEFPTNPFERFALLFGGAVNMGPKCALLWSFPLHGEFVGGADLTREFRDLVAGSDTPFDKIVTSRIESYCSDSLENIGLVAQSVNVDHGGISIPVAFGLTEAGQLYGRRAAAIPLVFEYNHRDDPELNLYNVFGTTQTGSKDDLRAPYTRARILMDLFTYRFDGARKYGDLLTANSDILDTLLISRSLSELAKRNIISINNSRKEHPVLVYGRPLNSPPPDNTFVQGLHSLKKDVFDASQALLLESAQITAEQVASVLFPHYEMSWKKPVFMTHLRAALKEITQKGYMEQVTEHWSQHAGSKITLNLRGTAITSEVLLPLFRLVSDSSSFDYIDKTYVAEVQHNPNQYMANAVARYWPHSPGYMRQLLVESHGVMIQAIQNAGINGIGVHELKQLPILDKLNTLSLRTHLSKLVRAGVLRRIDNGKKPPHYVTIDVQPATSS